LADHVIQKLMYATCDDVMPNVHSFNATYLCSETVNPAPDSLISAKKLEYTSCNNALNR